MVWRSFSRSLGVGQEACLRPWLDWDLILAVTAYSAASAADYFLTLAGIVGHEVRELNPLLRLYIEHLGAPCGLMVPKLLLGFSVVVASSLYIHDMHRRNRTRVRPQYILYPGALLTVLAPLHWIVLKAWL